MRAPPSRANAARVPLLLAASLLVVIAITLPGAAAQTARPLAEEGHRKRGLMCRKGGNLVITLMNTLYLRGQKRFKDFTAVPLKGRVRAWDGAAFTIPIVTVEDANKYVTNATLFPQTPLSQTNLVASGATMRRYVTPKFEYRAPVDKNATGDTIGYPTARPMDVMKFTAELFDGTSSKDILVELDIDVVNTRPRAIPGTFGIVNGQARYVTLPAHDIDQMNTPEFQEITAAWITAPADPAEFPCKVARNEGNAPFDFGAARVYNISADSLSVWVMPPQNSNSFRCVFNFTVADREGLVSATPSITITSMQAVKPRAYGSRVRLEKGRRTVTLDLYGSSGNVDPSDNMAFVLTYLPTRGKLYKLDSNIQDTPSPDALLRFPEGKRELVVSNGTSRRVRLVYQSDDEWLAANNQGTPGSMVPILNADSNAMRDNIHLTFYVQDRFDKSDEANVEIHGARNGAALVCNTTEVRMVVQSASAVVILDYGYAMPDGRMVTLPKVQRVVLKSEPNGVLAHYGHLVQTIRFENGTTTRTIHPGDYFSDEDRSLRWVPNPNVTLDPKMLQQPLVYRYRVISKEGNTCEGMLKVSLLAQGNPFGGDYGQTWLERATTGGLRLFAFRAPELPKDAKMAVVRIDSLAGFQGKLWRVNANVPVAQLPVFVGTGKRALTACKVLNCSNFKSERQIAEKDEVEAITDTRTGFSQVLFLYEPPAVPPARTQNPTVITFSFKTSAGGDWSPATPLHYFKIYIAQGALPQLEFLYDPPDVVFNMSDAPDLRVPVVFGDADHNFPASKYAVRVRSFSARWRHNSRPTFKLMQVAKVEGERFVPGDTVAFSTRDDVKGMWLTFNNSLVLIPTAGSRTKVFKFRVSVYPLSADGTIPDHGSASTMYRVIVRQRNNVPQWDIGGPGGTPTDVHTVLGTEVTIPLSLHDDEDDALSFRLLRAPHFGNLKYLHVTMGISGYRVLHEGMTFSVRKGSALRQQAFVSYLCDSATKNVFPLQDDFVVAADDGSGVLSVPLTIRVHVGASQTALENRDAAALPSATAAIGGVVIFLLVVVGVTILVVRRHRFQVYKALASADPSNVPHPGVNS